MSNWQRAPPVSEARLKNQPDIFDKPLLIGVASTLICFVALFGACLLLSRNSTPMLAIALFAGTGILGANVLSIRRGGVATVHACAAIVGAIAIYAAAAFLLGGLTGPVGAFGALVPLLAALVAGPAAGWMTLAAVMATVAALQALAIGGLIPPWDVSPTMAYTARFAAVAVAPCSSPGHATGSR